MWYLKKTAESVWTASKKLVDSRTPVEKLIDSIANSEQQIISTNKLNELASMTYDMEAFDQILDIFTTRLKVFHYDLEESTKTLNLLIATNYVIKHGATGFVDEFRNYCGVFKKYQSLKQVATYQDEKTQGMLDDNLDKIKSRAHHITVLLEDKEKLQKEKQLSMLVKQKLKLYEKGRLSDLKQQNLTRHQPKAEEKYSNLQKESDQNGENPSDFSTKLEGIMEKYLWRYVDKLDDTIEVASEKIMKQIDKYVIGQQIHAFEVEVEVEEKGEGHDHDNDDELMKKLQEESSQVKPGNVNLLDFEQVSSPSPKKQVQTENLLD